MSSRAIATLVKIMESLPETLQDRVVEHLREYLEDLRDEEQWNFSFQNTQESLIRAAKLAKQEISEGKVQPLDIDIALEIPTVAHYPSRLEFMQLSLEERRKILAKQAEAMLQHYHEDREWQELEAGDLIDY
jgi:hypothetical protein